MGQACPLPSRIPKPIGRELSDELTSAGVLLSSSQETYVEYVMPEGWKMVDCSEREDDPLYYMVDEKGMKRFQIYGSWKGTYDNYLRICAVDPPSPLIRPESSQLIPSETNASALMGTFAQAIDPLHRPPYKGMVKRQQDFCPSEKPGTTTRSHDDDGVKVKRKSSKKRKVISSEEDDYQDKGGK